MVCKHILGVFFIINVIAYSAADKFTESDSNQLKSAWAKVENNPVQYAEALTKRIIDEVVVPIATESLELLSFILPKNSKDKIVNLISNAKTFTTLPQFSEYTKSITDIISKTVIQNLSKFVEVLNNPEKFMTNYAEMILDVGLQLYHSNLEKAKPVLDSFMSKDWTAGEIAAVDKVIALLQKVDKDMIKRVIATIN